jgi:hypothetical protein
VAKSKAGLNTAQCRYCKEWISPEALRCPHCQSSFTPADQKAMKAERKGMLIGCGVLAAGLFLVVSFCSGTGKDAIPETPSSTAKTDAASFYKQVITTGSACDSAFTAASKQMASGDVVASYRAVQSAESICLPVGNDIRALEVPTSVGKAAHGKLTEAKDECAMVFTNKWSALNDIGEVIDSGGGVAKMAAVQDTMEQIQSGTIRCVAGLYAPLNELGVDLKTIQPN